MRYDFVVILHRLYDQGKIKKGGVDLIIDYLLKKNSTILLIEYPLDYRQSNQMRVSRLTYKETTPLYFTPVFIKVNIICWIIEFFLTLTSISKFSATGGTIITGDPLATLPAVLLRKAGMFKFHYYHVVDYSSARFKSALLNKLYTKILTFGLKNADLVGYVTRTAGELLTSVGIKRSVYLPNTMDYHSLDKIRKPTRTRNYAHLVITCSEVSPKYQIKELIHLINKIKKVIPETHLHIIGKFDAKSDYSKGINKYIDENNLHESVNFYGQLDREQNYNIIASCYIGLAFYDGNHSHVKYGDALKIREYSALGLPTVADFHTTTAREMHEVGGGYGVSDIDEAYNKIIELLKDATLYERCSEATLRWSKKCDKKKMLDDLYAKYF